MTKNEIIRELSNCNPRDVKSLYIIYHNHRSDVRYVYGYEFTSSLSSLDSRREFARVLLSLYKLRAYVISINVSYFGGVERMYDSYNRVNSISEFIKTV